MDDTSGIWWRQITGARNFLQKTADALASGKSAVICLSDATPWLDDMREILTDFLNKKFGGIRAIRKLDASTVGTDPAVVVFDKFCGGNVKASFIPFGEDAHVKFLAKRDDIILNKICLWIRGASKTQAESWHAFIADYHKFGGKGLFLLETGADFDASGKSGVETFSFESEVSEYDCYAFNIFLAAQFGKGDKSTKRYLAELASNVTGFDVERASEYIKRGNEFLKHPHAVADNKSPEEITRAVWVTQLKLIFPQLEIFRRDFVKHYEQQIERLLPCHLGGGKIIYTPDDAELGDLYSMLGVESWRLDPDDWERLKIYREARNTLAHLGTLTLSQVETILHC